MSLRADLRRFATTVDRPGAPDAARFSATERFELLTGVARAEDKYELTSLKHELEAKRKSPNNWREPMFKEADEGFRRELLREVNKRLRGKQSKPPDATAIGTAKRKRGEKRYAVLLIDAQYGREVREKGAALKREQKKMREVLAHANAHGAPVFEIVWPGKYETDDSFGAVRDPDNWVLVEKRHQDAFPGTGLLDELVRRGITDVVVMGLYQNLCVRSTARSAAKQGIRVHTSPEIIQGNEYISAELDDFYEEKATVTKKASKLAFFSDVG